MKDHSYWLNTPGAYYALAYTIGIIIQVINVPRRKNKIPTMLIIWGFTVIETFLMTITHGINTKLYVPLMAIFFLGIVLVLYELIDYDFSTVIFIAIEIFISGEFVASADWFLEYILVKDAFIKEADMVVIPLSAIVYSVLFFFVYLLTKRNRTVNAELVISWGDLISAVLIGLSIYVMSNITFLMQPKLAEESVIMYLFTVRTLVDLGGVAMLYAFHVQKGQSITETELMKLTDMMEMQKQNADIMEQSVAVVNQKYHDLKYQIQLLKDGISDGDSLKYLDQISEDIKNYEARNKTGNAALDTILTTKSLYCQANWIELTCVCDGHAIDFIDQVDIATLFGNLLDNAIEAVSKMEHKEKRLIHLTVSREKNFVKIRLENCTDDIPVMKNGLPQTTKKDKRYHGYGVKSIQSITRKYGGSVTFSVNDGWFESRVLMSVR